MNPPEWKSTWTPAFLDGKRAALKERDRLFDLVESSSQNAEAYGVSYLKEARKVKELLRRLNAENTTFVVKLGIVLDHNGRAFKDVYVFEFDRWIAFYLIKNQCEALGVVLVEGINLEQALEKLREELTKITS